MPGRHRHRKREGEGEGEGWIMAVDAGCAIVVEQLTKHFGSVTALDKVRFDVRGAPNAELSNRARPEDVDRRVVVKTRQARELLTAGTYVGPQRRGPTGRGQRLMAFYAPTSTPSA